MITTTSDRIDIQGRVHQVILTENPFRGFAWQKSRHIPPLMEMVVRVDHDNYIRGNVPKKLRRHIQPGMTATFRAVVAREGLTVRFIRPTKMKLI